MELFCFASRNLDNIWLGYRAKKWAVATVSDSLMRGRITKAGRYFRLGSRGVLYCRQTHAFTVPFVTKSTAEPNTVVNDIWPEPWVLPFMIDPLGSPEKMVPAESAKLRWPYLQQRPHLHGGVTAAMNATGVTAFVPIYISDEDWRLILEDLAD